MPVVLAPLFTFSLGLLLAQRQRGALGADGSARARTFVLLFAALVVLPGLLVTALEQPRWALLHLTQRPDIPSAALLGVALLAGSATVGGHRLGAELETLSERAALGVTLAPTVALLAVALLKRHALLRLGTTPGGDPIPLLGSGFELVLLGIDGLMILGFVLTAGAIDKLR